MRRFWLTLILLVACEAALRITAAASGALPVVASTTVLADFVRNVGGDQVQVTALAPAGADPHTFQPTPDSMRVLAEARVIFFNGAGLEEWWNKAVRSVSRRDVAVVELSRDLATLRVPGDSGGGRPDPHAWLDPVLARRYVERIRDALSRQDPAGGPHYADRAQAYLGRLSELDAWIRAEVERLPPARRKLITFHNAFQYFAKRYGFTVGFLMASPAQEPSAKALAELTRRIQREQVPALFAEADFNPKLLDVLARDAGVKVVTNLYDGSLSTGLPADTYLALMRHNVTMIVQALK